MRAAILLTVLALILTGLIYGPHVVSAGYVYEDHRITSTVAGAPALWWQPRGVTYALWTTTPMAGHALSLGLHLLVGVLVGWLAVRLGVPVIGGVLAAAVVWLHPLAIESVAYAAQRSELIAAIGVLAACLLATGPLLGWFLIPIALAVGALGKETAVAGLALVPLVGMHRDRRVWPLVLLGALAFMPLAYWRFGPAWWEYGTLSPLATAYPGVAWVYAPGDWLGLQITALWRLGVLTVAPWPAWFTPDPDLDRIALLARLVAAGCVSLGAVALWRLSAPLWRGALVAVAVIVLPRLVIQTPTSYFNDHQFYLPLCALVIGAAAVVAPRLHARPWLAAALLVPVAASSVIAVQPWRSDLTLTTHVVQAAPLKPRGWNNAGIALVTAGRLGDAQRAFARAETLAEAPYRPAWDRAQSRSAAQANLAALAQLEARVR